MYEVQMWDENWETHNPRIVMNSTYVTAEKEA